jgi:hypothetical protein
MRRYVVALFFILGCLVAGSAQAEQIRFPKTGPNAFVITMAPGWTSKEDTYNGLQLLAADSRTSVYLSMVLDQQYADKPMEDLALAIGAPSKITAFSKREPITISGLSGMAFYAQMTNANGTVLDVKMNIIPLGPALWATETLLTSQGLTSAQVASLNQAVEGIAIVNK